MPLFAHPADLGRIPCKHMCGLLAPQELVKDVEAIPNMKSQLTEVQQQVAVVETVLQLLAGNGKSSANRYGPYTVMTCLITSLAAGKAF